MLRTLITIAFEVAYDLLTGKLERPYRADKLRGDSRQWGALVRTHKPDDVSGTTPEAEPGATPAVLPSGRR